MTCYKARPFENLVREVVCGFHFSPKIFKVDIWSSELNLPILGGKIKKGPLRVNCKAFFTWVGDGVGGPLGGDEISKARPQAPSRQDESQHESSAQDFYFLQKCLVISWKP